MNPVKTMKKVKRPQTTYNAIASLHRKNRMVRAIVGSFAITVAIVIISQIV